MDHRGIDGAKPERTRSAKVQAVIAAIDPQRRSEPSGATRKVQQPCRLAMTLHGGHAVERFERANQHAASYVSPFAAHIQHEVIAIGEVDVAVAMAEEERTIAASRAAVVVARRITRGIGLGLDDAAAEAARGKVMDDDFADKKTSEPDRVRGKFRKVQAANGDFLCAAPRRQNGLIIFLAVLFAMFRALSKFSLPSFLDFFVLRL